MLLLWREEFSPIFYAVVTVWAFVAAFVLLREALRQRARVTMQRDEIQ